MKRGWVKHGRECGRHLATRLRLLWASSGWRAGWLATAVYALTSHGTQAFCIWSRSGVSKNERGVQAKVCWKMR